MKNCSTCDAFGHEALVRGGVKWGSCRADLPKETSTFIAREPKRGADAWVGNWPYVKYTDWCRGYAPGEDRTATAVEVFSTTIE